MITQDNLNELHQVIDLLTEYLEMNGLISDSLELGLLVSDVQSAQSDCKELELCQDTELLEEFRESL